MSVYTGIDTDCKKSMSAVHGKWLSVVPVVSKTVVRKMSRFQKEKMRVSWDIRDPFYSNIYSNYRIKRNEVILIVKENDIQRDTSGAFYNVGSGKEY